MSKYHINKKGVPAPCKATKGNCPLGGDESHFNTQEEAQTYADKVNAEEHSLLPGVQGNNRFGMEKEQFDNLKNKAVSLNYENDKGEQESLDGNVKEVNWEDNTITVRNKDDIKDEREINLNSVSDFESSRNNYFSKEYKQELRDQNKPQDKFRFSEEKLKQTEGKYVVVDYDGKRFDGKVIDSNYIDRNNSGLIIENENGEVKHIKNYRMQDLDTTGETLEDHKYRLEVNKIHDEFEKNSSDYDAGDPEALEEAEQNPQEQVDNYIEASIRKNSGENVDLSKYNYDWTEEVERNQEDYTDVDYGGYADTSGPNESFSEERFEEALSQSEEVNEYYDLKKDQVNDVFDSVRKVDWRKHGYKTQVEGENQAMRDLMDEGLFE